MKIRLQIAFILFFSLIGIRIVAQDLSPAQWPHMTGYWKFQDANKLTKATVGNDLTLVGTHQRVAGPSFYDTAIRIAIGSYYKCRHNIAPNGGGDSVNRYTLMFDFRILSLKKWHTFFQTDTTNQNDGECFIRPTTQSNPGRIGTATTGYTPTTVTPNQWYRLVISVNLGNFYRYYLNGQLILEGDTQDIDDRFSLNPHFLLFADNDQEDDTIDIASVAVFDTCLSSADISKIGTIDPCVLYPISLSLGNDTTICGNNTLTKSAGTGNYTYKWSTGETTSSLIFSMSKLGTGQKTIWVKKMDINSCSLADTFVLGIYNPPNVDLGKDTNLCQGQKVKYIAGSATNNSFVWKKLPLGTIVSKVNNLTIDSSGIYTVTMSNQYGCYDMDTIIVTVHPTPAKPTINASNKDICLGDSAQLSGPSGYKTYIWSSGDTTKNIHVNSSSTLSLQVWDIYGCESPLSDSVHVEVHALPSAPVLIFSPDTILCQGDSTLLSVTNNQTSYIWNDGAGNAARYVKQSGVFNLYVKDIFGCRSVVSNTVSVTVNPKPGKPEIEVLGPVNRCMGDSIVLRSKNISPFYQWNNPSTSRSITAKTGGIFKLMVRNVYNCKSEWSDSVELIFHPVPPKPSILSLGKDSLTCSVTARKYLWFINGIAGSDTLKSLKAIDKSGYRVRIATDWCLSELSDSFYFEKTGISSLRVNNGLLVYPNPSSRIVCIKMVNLVDGLIYTLFLTDISGKTMLVQDIDAGILEKGISLDLSEWPAGRYIARIYERGAFYTARFEVY